MAGRKTGEKAGAENATGPILLDGVQKQLTVFVSVYNGVLPIILGPAEQQKPPPDRISFADPLPCLSAARNPHILINLIVNPRRPARA